MNRYYTTAMDYTKPESRHLSSQRDRAMVPEDNTSRRHTVAKSKPLTRDQLAAMFDKAESFALIINATHERGERQALALDEMALRGLYLSHEQMLQAGVTPQRAGRAA